MNEITEVLPELLRDAISAVPEEARRDTEEIRIRVDRPVELIQKGQPLYLSYVCTAGDAQLILSRLSNYSMYTLEEELKKRIYHNQRRPPRGAGRKSHRRKRSRQRTPGYYFF